MSIWDDIISVMTGHFDDPGNYMGKTTTAGKGLRIDDNLFSELMIFDRPTLAKLTPFLGGRFLFIPAEMPACMEVLHKKETDYIRVLLRTTVLSINGFADHTIETTPINAGSEQNTIEIGTKAVAATRQLTFTFIAEWQSLPMLRYVTTWMYYVYNLGSMAATYPHFIPNMEYHEGNHTMSAMYIIVDPSFKYVQFATAIYAMLPTSNMASSFLNQTLGEHNYVPYEVQFKVACLPIDHPNVIETAQKYLAYHVTKVTLHDHHKKVEPLSAIFNR